MQFPVFEHLRTSIHAYRKDKGIATGTLRETAPVTTVSAGLAGAMAALITTPIDVIKTRIMLRAANSDHARGEEPRKVVKEIEAQGEDAKVEIEKARQAARGGRAGGLAVGREILRTEGAKGLFKGGALRGL